MTLCRIGSNESLNLNFGDIPKSAKSIPDTWLRFLLQIKGLTEERAKAVIDVYPTLHKLFAEYEKVTVTEGENLLANVSVRIGGRSQNSKKFGPVLSKKVYYSLMGEDPDEFVNK